MMKFFNIPIWIKSIFLGFIILEVTTKIWSLVAVANIRLTPEIPWSFPIMTLVLYLIWKYLNGSWLPQSTQKNRQLWMRANPIKPEQQKSGWLAAFLLGLTLIQLILISTRLMDSPSGQISQIERISVYPVWTVFALILMTSLVAGIAEEIAFRGYMQKPLELAYSPKIAIAIVVLFFTLIHLPNATIALHLVPLFFFGSIGWGILAYLTDSIIPGIVVHTLIDVIGYLWIWKSLDFAKALSSESVIQNGVDFSFLILLTTTFLSLSALIIAFFQLSKIKEGLNQIKVG